MDSTLINFKNDLFLAMVYVLPESPSCSETDIEMVYAQLMEDVTKYSKMGNIMIQCDCNAYTNTSPDFILYDESNHATQNDTFNIHDNMMSRNNLDHKRVNNSGKYLLNMCKEARLRILNGRSTCDLFGNPTCIAYNGCGLAYYTLVSCDLLNSVGYFQVHDFTALSDHCPIVCGLCTTIAIDYTH